MPWIDRIAWFLPGSSGLEDPPGSTLARLQRHWPEHVAGHGQGPEWYSPRSMTQPRGQTRLPRWVRAAWLPGALLLAALIGVALRYGESARFAEMLSRA